MTFAAPGPVPSSWWDLEDPVALGFPPGEWVSGGAPVGAALAGALRGVFRGRLKKRRKPLQQRTGSVKEGRPQKFPALVVGETAWCPDTYDAQRTVHLTGPLAWHTTRRGYNPARIPLRDVRPVTLRRPDPADELEQYGVARPNWLVLDLDSASGGAKLLAHGADLALLGLVAEWSFPRVRWWA